MRYFLAFLLATSAHATSYRVDGISGSDDNDGVTAPFRTIGRAVKSLRRSDTLVLTPMPEPYRESLPLRIGGTATEPFIVEGGGATLSGADPAPADGWRVAGNIWALDQAREVRFLFGPDACYEKGASATDIGPEQWFWEADVLSFRPTEGRSPSDYSLEMSVRVSGILTSGAGQIIVRDLTCKHFFNDGFNIHGGSAPLWFERIRGVWNGDEGFSAHENCECYVRDGVFSHNQCHGIADIDYARTHYSGITVEDNVLKGIFFIGGFHSVIDSTISGRPENIAISPSGRAGFPQSQHHPIRRATTNLRNVVVDSSDGQVGLHLRAGADCALEHCLVRGGRAGLVVDADATAYAINTIIADANDAEVVAGGSYAGDHNLYFPGRLIIGAEAYAPGQFADYQAATGNDAHSWVSEPAFIADTLWSSRASRAFGAAFDAGGFGGPDIGPVPLGTRPKEDASVLAPNATR